MSTHREDYGIDMTDAQYHTVETLRQVTGMAMSELVSGVGTVRKLEELYTGWSRFFLVTSSNGHVHSSMHCSTCRPTTTYGWLPELSGSTEAEAVADLGSNLCSVCFPTAPVEHQGGKLTAAQARNRTGAPDLR